MSEVQRVTHFHWLDLEKYRMFERAGLKVHPLAWSAWHRDRDGCLTKILERLGGATA